MADYQKIYAFLCNAIDEVLEPLEKNPLTQLAAKKPEFALLQAEGIYIETTISEEKSHEITL